MFFFSLVSESVGTVNTCFVFFSLTHDGSFLSVSAHVSAAASSSSGGRRRRRAAQHAAGRTQSQIHPTSTDGERSRRARRANDRRLALAPPLVDRTSALRWHPYAIFMQFKYASHSMSFCSNEQIMCIPFGACGC